MDEQRKNRTPTKPTDRGLSRRELLKAVTALGGAAAASPLLPERWSQPEIDAGALPAHAIATIIPPYTILRCDLDVTITPDSICWATSVWIDPPTPGIPMVVVVGVETGSNDLPSKGPENAGNGILTDDTGKASTSPCLTGFDTSGLIGGNARWYFHNTADGTDTCYREDYPNED